MSPGRSLLCAGALALLACGQTKLSGAQPRLAVTPQALDFGQTPRLFPVQRTLTLQDAGSAPLTLGALSLRGPDAQDFAFLSAPGRLLPGQTAAVQLTCAPHAEGPLAAELWIDSDDVDQPVVVVPLTCVGTAQTGALSVEPAELDFGRVGEGESRVLELRLRSGGPADLFLSSFSFTPPGAFGLVGSVQAGTVLPAGASAAVAVRFSPSPDTPAAQGTLQVASSDPLHPLVDVALRGTINRAPLAVARAHLAGEPPQDTLLTTGVGATVLLDGTGSTDPDFDLPLSLRWTLALKPEGSAAQPSSATSATPSLVLDLPGLYSLSLLATDSAGLASFTAARVDLRAVPPMQLLVELVWDAQRPDLDLHVRQEGAALGSASDCSWMNPDPVWFPGGGDRNPHHLGDALVGYGPEDVQWKEPAAGRYRLAVVGRSLNGDTRAPTARVRVRAFGVLVAELVKTVAAGETWEAGVVDWPTGRVTQSAQAGASGTLREGPGAAPEGGAR